MDTARTPRRRLPPVAIAAVATVGVFLAAAGSLQLLARTSALPSIDRATLLTDVVRRAPLSRTVDAPGTFQPGRIRIIAAVQSGVLEQIYVKPGSVVEPGTPIASLVNPDIEAATAIAASQVDVARADLSSAREQARAFELTQQSAYEDERAQQAQDLVQRDAYAKLHAYGYVAENQYRGSVISADKSARQLSIAGAQVRVAAAEATAKIAEAEAQLDQALATLTADRAQVAALMLRSKVNGVVQSVALDPGARMEPGAEIARVADPRDLKVVLAVGESEIAGVRMGMDVVATTGSRTYRGRVARIAPTAQNGTVDVDVTFAAPPVGALADAAVEGSVLISRLGDTLSISRPAGALDDSTATLFRVVGDKALRTTVRLGDGSLDRVAILSGLAAGETVIISDTSGHADDGELQLR